MTVVAALQLTGTEDWPLLFGDLLTTGETPASRPPARVPMIGDVTDFFGDSGWSIMGLAQKVVVVTDYLALAWAGWWVDARVAIAALREAADARRLEAADVVELLRTLPDLQAGRTTFVGFIEQQGEIACFHGGRVEDFDTPIGRVLAAAGSGVTHLREFMRNCSSPTRVDGNLNGPQLAVSSSLRIAAQLLALEHRGGANASTLLHSFGGGYETAMFDVEFMRFRKLPEECTYVFWDGAHDGQQILLSQMPLLMLKQRYVDHALVLRSVILNPQSRLLEDHRFVVMPMFEARPPTLERLEQTKWRSREYCHCVVVRTGTGVRFLTAVEFIRQSEPRLTIDDERGGVHIEGIDRVHELLQSLSLPNR